MVNENPLLQDVASRIASGDAQVHTAVLERFSLLAVPPQALGRLVDPVARIAASQGTAIPVAAPAACVVFIADHGIARDDTVTPWPQNVTRTVAELAAQGRAACAAISRSVGADLVLVDIGIATGTTPDGVIDHRVRHGSEDMRIGPAIDISDVHRSYEAGARVAEGLHERGTRIAAVGEIGIGNTTAASAIIAILTEVDPTFATGRGSGIDDATLERKRLVVSDLVERCRGRGPDDLLAESGALEVSALVGFMLSAASRHIPVVLDGVTTLAAALVAREISGHVVDHLVVGHRSPEPAVDAALAVLGLDPMIDFGLRVGEGTGALLALPLLAAGCEILSSVARLDEVT